MKVVKAILFLLVSFFILISAKFEKHQESSRFNNVKIHYSKFMHNEDSLILDYLNLYIKNELIKEVYNAYKGDSFLKRSLEYNNEDSIWYEFYSIVPNYSDVPYYIYQKGQYVYTYNIIDTTVKHLQYSLNVQDTTRYVGSHELHKDLDFREMIGVKCNYTGIDTTIYVGDEKFECYKFFIINVNYFYSKILVSDLYVEKSQFIPLIKNYRHYKFKGGDINSAELKDKTSIVAYKITPTGGYMPPHRDYKTKW
jgi:hypothetical protein